MGNLQSEVRVNKNGVPVKKYVRSDVPDKPKGLLSRLLPHLNNSYKKAQEERKAELLDIFTIRIKEELSAIEADRQAEINAETDPVRQAGLILYSDDVDDRYDQEKRILVRIAKLSTSTLEMVDEVYSETGNLTNILDRTYRSEEYLRAGINFRQFLTGRPYESATFRDVKSSMGIDDLSLIDPDSSFHASVSSVLNVATSSSSKRTTMDPSSRYPGKYQDYDMESDTLYDDESYRVHMTPELAAIIVEYPDRCEDIVDYLGVWSEGEPAKADCEHLRLFLDNPTPALSDGIL